MSERLQRMVKSITSSTSRVPEYLSPDRVGLCRLLSHPLGAPDDQVFVEVRILSRRGGSLARRDGSLAYHYTGELMDEINRVRFTSPLLFTVGEPIQLSARLGDYIGEYTDWVHCKKHRMISPNADTCDRLQATFTPFTYLHYVHRGTQSQHTIITDALHKMCRVEHSNHVV